ATAGRQVQGFQNQIAIEPFTGSLQFATKTNDEGERVPDCTAAPGLLAVFGLRPQGCTAGVDCSAILTSAISGGAAIPDGVALYSCKVTIAGTAGADLRCGGAHDVQPDEQTFPADCVSGHIVVEGTQP